MWYSAHAIFYFSYFGQDSFLVHENVYLVEAGGEDQAMLIAKQVAAEHEDLSEDGHLEVNGNKAQYRFAGIRKLIEVELDSEAGIGKLHSGVETTYSVLEVDDFSEVERLAAGEMTSVLYRE